MQELKIKGIYKHFKGDYYLVEDIAFHSETKEEYVIYRKLYSAKFMNVIYQSLCNRWGIKFPAYFLIKKY